MRKTRPFVCKLETIFSHLFTRGIASRGLLSLSHFSTAWRHRAHEVSMISAEAQCNHGRQTPLGISKMQSIITHFTSPDTLLFCLHQWCVWSVQQMNYCVQMEKKKLNARRCTCNTTFVATYLVIICLQIICHLGKCVCVYAKWCGDSLLLTMQYLSSWCCS